MKIGQLLQIMLWWLSIFLMELEQIGAENVVVFLRDSILDKVELRKGNRKMNNKKHGSNQMGRVIFWLKRKKRMEKKKCGHCCLMCPFYLECRNDGEL